MSKKSKQKNRKECFNVDSYSFFTGGNSIWSDWPKRSTFLKVKIQKKIFEGNFLKNYHY